MVCVGNSKLFKGANNAKKLYVFEKFDQTNNVRYWVSQKEVPPTFEKSLKKIQMDYLYGSKAYYVFGVL